MHLCVGIHNLLQVVLDETENCHPLVSEVDELVGSQMQRFGLSQESLARKGQKAGNTRQYRGSTG